MVRMGGTKVKEDQVMLAVEHVQQRHTWDCGLGLRQHGPPALGTKEISENRGIYLLGSEDAIWGSKLPSSGQVLSVFLHNHLNLKQERAESAKVVVGKVLVFWNKARIPTQRQDKILAKVQSHHDRWKGLKKNQGRQTQTQRTSKERFKTDMGNLFDVAHTDALKLIKKLEDQDFLLAQRELERSSQADRLYIASQTRDGDLAEFFRHENQACPPSLSQLGKLRLGTKSDLLMCLESCAEVRDDAPKPDTDGTILDGAVLVNVLKPVAAKTFDDYALKVFLPHIQGHLQRGCRVYIVWDQYRDNSLKSQARDKRGKGIRRRVDGSTVLPGNWQQFLRIDANKTELFAFLTKHITHLVSDKQIVTTYGSDVTCIPACDTSHLAPCDHEEADTRMMIHLADAVRDGFQKILLRTVDTDIVVLAVAATTKLKIQEFWVAFATGQHFCTSGQVYSST
ncbi:hypothetical protein GWK47_008187 [Chionoecetes opilio]|uniref:Uncharacterized protein n=1 Tax=Chionoecetes opilio TaxID=41210 RepID=A0A8J4XYM1_CHIOP|nr:hypothetical protein GWK47_008187 [Chionoecetes opilio]